VSLRTLRLGDPDAYQRLMRSLKESLSDWDAIDSKDFSTMYDTAFGLAPIERTPAEKRKVLEETRPKIVDEKKYHGPAATDFEAIKKRMKEL
jgi:hypothetical protein